MIGAWTLGSDDEVFYALEVEVPPTTEEGLMRPRYCHEATHEKTFLGHPNGKDCVPEYSLL